VKVDKENEFTYKM